MSLTRLKRGKEGEKLAINYLKGLNHQILSTNFKTKFGEIDIISAKNDYLYFIEVKTRSNIARGMPYEAIDDNKISKIKKSAGVFLLKKNFYKYKLKVSAISIILEENKLDFWEDIES